MDCKTCKTCGIEKSLSEFYKDRKYKNTQYYQSNCKSCLAKERKEYYDNPKNKEAILARRRERYADKNKEEIVAKRKEYYAKKREVILTRQKEYRADPKNKEKQKKYRAQYNADPKNRKKISVQKTKRDKERRQSDPLYKLKHNTRSLISRSITNAGFKKNSKTHKILNCSFEEFMSHLEKQFNSGITWENYGKWHLDHIVPVSLASTEEEIIKLNHYKNFQPMWGPENNSKSNKIIHEMITPELQEKYKEMLQRV